MGTLYLFYHDAILAAGYILLLIVAFLNLNRMLAFLNRAVEAQAATLTDVNASLEGRVSEQVEKMERLARLKRFLPREITDLITSEGKESQLQSHRGYISCLFCDIRRFTSMTESIEPEDVMDVLRSFHDEIGRLVLQYQGTIGYRASDGAKGMIGTEGRFDYIPIGNAVNLSARLSDQAKDDEILINHRALANI